MGENSEVKNRTGRVLGGADMVYAITKQQSTNPRILRIVRTFPMLTMRGNRPLLVNPKNSPNPGICRNHRNARNQIKLLYRYDRFLDFFATWRNIMDIGNDMVVLIFE